MSRYENVVPLAKAADVSAEGVSGPHRAKHMVFADQASRVLLELLDRVAPSGAPIQIAGETGTGKELIARYIHRKSARPGPFLAVNCSAISEHLAESELFGHEAGSFTGAHSKREGWFEAADGGTLFLDEIGDLPPALQGKLLRALQEGEVTRIGGRKPIPVDVRIVSATNVNLEVAVEGGRFRRDLWYRLNMVPIVLPSLRDRPGDISALAQHFVAVYSAKLKRRPPTLTVEAMDKLVRHTWPGNIRELENIVHYGLLLSSGEIIGPEDIRITATLERKNTAALHADQRSGQNPGFLKSGDQTHAVARVREALRESFVAPGGTLLRDIERQLVAMAFHHCNSNQVRTAELLGVSRNVVRTLLKRYALISDSGSREEDCEPAVSLDHLGMPQACMDA